MTNQIYPCLWFDNQAKAAAEYYCSIFNNSKIISESSFAIQFELEGKRIMGLNGGPMYKISPSISLFVTCGTVEEIDIYWEKLSEGGVEVQCGWLKDKYGVSWQVIPSILGQLMSDPERGTRVMKELMKMKKLDIKTLEGA